jgi:monoamine oxidase
MRLSRRSRNSVKHKSTSVEFADQTGGRVLTIRLEFSYTDRPKLLEARHTILRPFFMGPG